MISYIFTEKNCLIKIQINKNILTMKIGTDSPMTTSIGVGTVESL